MPQRQLFLGLHKEHNFLVGRIKDRTGIGHAGHAPGGSLNIPHFNAVPPQLDLTVLPADVLNEAIRLLVGKITRSVHLLPVGAVERIGYKRSGRLRGVIPIAQRQLAADDAQLSRLPHSRLGVILSENENAHVGAGIADGQRIRVSKRTIHQIDGAVYGDLRGTIEIGKERIGKGAAPDIELLVGHDLTGKYNGL